MTTDLNVIAQLERQLDILIPHKKGELYAHAIGYRSIDGRTVIGLSLPNLGIGDISFIEELRNLKELYLSNNNIVDLDALQDFTSLKVLWLNKNNISNLGPLSFLTGLSVLWLNDNQIVSLSPLERILTLESLWLSNNQINDISPLKNLLALQILDLRSNPIEILPTWVVARHNMDVRWINEQFYPEGITFFNNPLIDPPAEIVQLGKEAMIAWFRSGDRFPINEVKILLVGHGDVGKTTLVKCLTGKAPDPDEKTTHQINITNDKLTFKDQEILINFWDFGGQEVMHSTHQFFLSRRSLYLLVLDGRRDEDAEYWLKYIESFGGNSPVLVVLNKIDTNERYDLDRIFLQKKYPFILGFYKTICKPDNIRGIPALHAAIEQALEKVPLIKSKWPKNWNGVKQDLVNVSENYITQTGYVKICRKNNITDSKMQEILAEYLHDLGVAVHFKGLNLSNMHILQPKWVSRAAYKIINSKIVTDNRGVLSMDDMSNIMQKEGGHDFDFPIHTFSYILTLMEKFELCYVLDKDKYLIPELLDIQQPKLPIQEGEILGFYFEYESLLPSSIMTRFIVRMSRDIVGDFRWRTGVVLSIKEFESLAIIIADIKERRIYVNVSGPGRREHFAIIRKTFHSLHNSFEKLIVSEKLALPGEVDKYVKYAELRGYSKAGIFEYFFAELEKKFNVKELLDTIEPENIRTHKYQWDVFLSYASENKELIEKIAGDLRERKIKYWIDEEQIMPGEQFNQGITNGLQNSRVIVPCLSKQHGESLWCKNEYMNILSRIIDGLTDQIIAPLILDNTKDGEIPVALASLRCERYFKKDQYDKFLDFLAKKSR